MGKKVSTEATVQDICRQTRRQHNAEEKIRIVLDGLREEETISRTKAILMSSDFSKITA